MKRHTASSRQTNRSSAGSRRRLFFEHCEDRLLLTVAADLGVDPAMQEAPVEQAQSGDGGFNLISGDSIAGYSAVDILDVLRGLSPPELEEAFDNDSKVKLDAPTKIRRFTADELPKAERTVARVERTGLPKADLATLATAAPQPAPAAAEDGSQNVVSVPVILPTSNSHHGGFANLEALHEVAASGFTSPAADQVWSLPATDNPPIEATVARRASTQQEFAPAMAWALQVGVSHGNELAFDVASKLDRDQITPAAHRRSTPNPRPQHTDSAISPRHESAPESTSVAAQPQPDTSLQPPSGYRRPYLTAASVILVTVGVALAQDRKSAGPPS